MGLAAAVAGGYRVLVLRGLDRKGVEVVPLSASSFLRRL